MLKKISKIIIFNTMGLITKIFFKFLKKSNKIYVINYHTTYPEFNSNFIKQLNFFKKHFEFADINTLKKGLFSKKPQILLTFDDAHVSNIQISSLLSKNKIFGIFFVPVKYVMRETEKNIENEFKITTEKFSILSNFALDKKNNYQRLSMKLSDLKNLKKKGFEVGCHSMNHLRLNKELNKFQLSEEIIESKKILEKELKIKIDLFCWVIGDDKSYSYDAYNLIIKNYKYSFMTLNKAFGKHDSPFQIQRFNVETQFNLNQVSFILSGIYEYFYKFKRLRLNRLLRNENV
jgi:peptidoglycan/xylan/chitin deacetylase (PgdA/CDA1 family)